MRQSPRDRDLRGDGWARPSCRAATVDPIGPSARLRSDRRRACGTQTGAHRRSIRRASARHRRAREAERPPKMQRRVRAARRRWRIGLWPERAEARARPRVLLAVEAVPHRDTAARVGRARTARRKGCGLRIGRLAPVGRSCRLRGQRLGRATQTSQPRHLRRSREPRCGPTVRRRGAGRADTPPAHGRRAPGRVYERSCRVHPPNYELGGSPEAKVPRFFVRSATRPPTWRTR